MEKLSAVIITYNEEKNIERCISSLQKVADEIVVLDSFSTDKTEEICRQMGVEFHQHKFDGYGTQKNRALKLASHNWILSLDADEVLSDKLISEIKKVKQSTQTTDNYRFNRLNFICETPLKHIWQPDYKIRLWKKNTGEWTNQKLHETFAPNKNTTTKTLKGNLLHYSFKSIEQLIDQTNKFTTIAAKSLFEKGKKASIFKIYTKTFFSFFKNFIIKFAFLDGFYGLVVARTNTYATFLKYSKLRHLTKKSSNEKNFN